LEVLTSTISLLCDALDDNVAEHKGALLPFKLGKRRQYPDIFFQTQELKAAAALYHNDLCELHLRKELAMLHHFFEEYLKSSQHELALCGNVRKNPDCSVKIAVDRFSYSND